MWFLTAPDPDQSREPYSSKELLKLLKNKKLELSDTIYTASGQEIEVKEADFVMTCDFEQGSGEESANGSDVDEDSDYDVPDNCNVCPVCTGDLIITNTTTIQQCFILFLFNCFLPASLFLKNYIFEGDTEKCRLRQDCI